MMSRNKIVGVSGVILVVMLLFGSYIYYKSNSGVTKSTNVKVVSTPINVNKSVIKGVSVPSGFVLANETYSKQDDSSVRNVSVFMSLGDRKSSDFFLMNTRGLYHYLSNNRIVLNIIPIPDDNSFSTLFFNALTVWTQKHKNVDDGHKVLDFIVQASKYSWDMKNKTINEQQKLIMNILQIEQKNSGEFFDGKHANRLFDLKNNSFVVEGKTTLPLLVVDGVKVDDKTNLNNIEDVYKAIFG